MIAEGISLIERAAAMWRPGQYQLEAAIVACHAEAASWAATDWRQIAALYGVLARIHPSPVVELNRAVALAMSGEIELGLRLVEELDGGAELAGYHLLHVARAELLRRLGRHVEAAASYRRALELVGNEPERRHLEKRLREIAS
jgi:RNA polymerase sigma-70 factor (ECF subfamily)